MSSYEEHPSKVTAWRSGQFVVLPEARSADCTVWFAYEADDAGEPQWEGLLACRLDHDRARVAAIPYWIYDLGLGDEVKIVSSAEDALVAEKVVADAGQVTFRVILSAEDQWRDLMRELEPLECWFDVRTPRFVAISVPPANGAEVGGYLARRQSRGGLQFETGRSSLSL